MTDRNNDDICSEIADNAANKITDNMMQYIMESGGVAAINIQSIAIGMKVARDSFVELLQGALEVCPKDMTAEESLKLLLEDVPKFPIVGEC